MKKFILPGAVLALASSTLLSGASTVSADEQHKPHTSPAKSARIQDDFDSLGPTVHATELKNGRTAHYTDQGRKNWKPVLFIGGTGTSARAVGMTDFMKSTRKSLKLRMISVERNGFGDTKFNKNLRKKDYSQDVVEILDKLDVDKVSVVAVSGGGPYAADLAARAPKRIDSLHLASALPPYGKTNDSFCSLSAKQQRKQVAGEIQDPRKWWAQPEDSPTRKIPGFVDTAYEDGARTYYLRGQKGDPSAQVHEQRLYCQRPGPDLSKLDAPVVIYSGDKDTTVPPSTIRTWKKHLPQKPLVRHFADTGHDEQYRHWDQILTDVAGHTDRTVICHNKHSIMAPAGRASRLLKHHKATLGSCAWQHTSNQD